MKSRGSEINYNPSLQCWELRVSYMYHQPYKFGPQKILITTKMQCIWKISIPNKFAKSFDYTSPWQKEKVILWQNVEWNVLCYLIGTSIYNEIITTFSYSMNTTLWHFKEIVYSGWEISLRIWVIATHELYSLRGLLQYVIQYLSLRSFSCLFIKQRPLYSPIKSSVKWGILNIMQICTLPCIISHLCICIIEIGGAVFSSTQELLYVTKVMC